MIMLISSLEQMLTLKSQFRVSFKYQKKQSSGKQSQMERTSRCSDAVHREEGMLQTLRAPQVAQAAKIPPLALHRPTPRAPESSVPWGEVLLLTAMDCAP